MEYVRGESGNYLLFEDGGKLVFSGRETALCIDLGICRLFAHGERKEVSRIFATTIWDLATQKRYDRTAELLLYTCYASNDSHGGPKRHHNLGTARQVLRSRTRGAGRVAGKSTVEGERLDERDR